MDLRQVGFQSDGIIAAEVEALEGQAQRHFVDNVPNVQRPQSVAVDFALCSGTNAVNYRDHIGLETDFGPEIEATAEVESLLREGAAHVHMLYTFRSVARAVPMTPDAKTKHDLDLATFEALKPQIEKIRALMDFQEKGIVLIKRHMRSLCHSDARHRVVPDGYYDAITKVIDLLQKVDNLKDMKASVATDFSRYNRVLQALRKDLPDGDQLAQEKHKLQLFLSNFQYPKSLIFHNLRDALKQIDGHEDFLIEMLQQNIESIEHERYLTPDEKYRLIRSLPHLMLLIDGDSSEGGGGGARGGLNVFKDKRVKVSPLQAIFRAYPVVPEYGDMSMTMLVILRRSPHWDDAYEKAWGGDADTDRRVATRYSLPHHWPEIKRDHAEFMSQFTKLVNELETYAFKRSLAEAKYWAFVAKLVCDGFKLLQRWTCQVLEAYHWKLTHPCSADDLAARGAKPGGSPYEAAVKYNLGPREIGCFVDVVSMVKSLASALAGAEARVAPYVRAHVHHECQQFAMGELLPPLHRAHKRKRAIIGPLLKLRRLVADWTDSSGEPADDYARYSRQDGRVEARHVVRVVGPSPTQLQLLRTMVRSMYDQRTQLRVGVFAKKDLEKDDVQLMELFYNKSLAFGYLLNYAATLRATSDLGDLWYREFYLELSGQVQFPIELSLPWILTEHIITNQARTMPLVENILYTMEAYNDAAQRALFVLNSKFLYDELEAEVNLVCDQFVFLMADHVYTYYKDVAAANAVDGPYGERLRQLRRVQVLDAPARRYDVAVSQRRIQLLGRALDLNHVIAQHVNATFARDVDYCLKKFEASDHLAGVVDLRDALAVLRGTHDALAAQLALDPFDCILREVDESAGPAAFGGRTVQHVLASLVTDVVPNSAYNLATRRFVRSPIVRNNTHPADRPTRKAPRADHQHYAFGVRASRAFEMSNKLHRGFVGRTHCEAVVETVGASGVALVVNGLLANLGERLEIAKAYLDAIKDGLPPCKLPKAMYGLAGCYGVFDALLKPILAYADLKPEVFQAFKDIGNTLVFIRDLSDVLARRDLERDLAAVDLYVHGAADAAAAAAWNNPDLALMINAAAAAPPPSGTAASSPRTTSPRPPREGAASSLFHGALRDFAALVEPFRRDWGGGGGAAHAAGIELEAATEFHRLWSALSFLFGLQVSVYENNAPQPPPVPSSSSSQKDIPNKQPAPPPLHVTDDAEFGHGFFVAGAALVHALGQTDRFDALDFSTHVLRVEEYERASTHRAQGVGVADQTLRDEAHAFVTLKAKHRRLFQLALALFTNNEDTNTNNPASLGTTTTNQLPRRGDGPSTLKFHPPAA